MKNKLASMVAVGAAFAMSFASVASATEIGYQDTLANLVQGGSIAIGDKTFSGFTYQNTGLNGFDASQINVVASIDQDGVYYLTYNGQIALGGTGQLFGDLLLGYTVTASQGAIYGIDQSYTGSSRNGILAVDETVRIGGGVVVANSRLSTEDLSDPGDFSLEAGPDQLVINPARQVLYVTKDIQFFISTSENQVGLVTISQVQQSFHQTSVPDGGSMLILFGSALSLLGLIRSRIA